MDQYLRMNEKNLKGIFGYCEGLYVCDTYQVQDYSLYTINIFDPIHKLEQKEQEFPKDLQRTYELGKRLTLMEKDSKNLI